MLSQSRDKYWREPAFTVSAENIMIMFHVIVYIIIGWESSPTVGNHESISISLCLGTTILAKKIRVKLTYETS